MIFNKTIKMPYNCTACIIHTLVDIKRQTLHRKYLNFESQIKVILFILNQKNNCEVSDVEWNDNY